MSDLASNTSDLSPYTIELTATVEQAIRWIAKKQPPLAANLERIAGYGSVIENTSKEVPSFFWIRDEYEEACGQLFEALATGRLDCYGSKYYSDLNTPGIHLLKVRPDDHLVKIPKGIWDIPSEFKDPRHQQFVVKGSDHIYLDIWIPFEGLADLFPSDDMQAPKKGKRKVAKKLGRPRIVEDEVLLQIFNSLMEEKVINIETPQLSIATFLVDRLKLQGHNINASTLERGFVRNTVRAAKEKGKLISP